MRILHLIPSVASCRGGPSQAVLSMVASLRESGVDASIVTTNDNGNSLPSLPVGAWSSLDVNGTSVPILAFRRVLFLKGPFDNFLISPGLLRWLYLNAVSYDLVHVHALFSFTTSVGMAVLRHQRVPYVLRTIGQLNRWSLRQSRARKLLFLKLLDRNNLLSARFLHFTSQAERCEAADLNLATPCFVLPLGVPVLPRLSISCKKNFDGLYLTRFLFLSRIHPKKQLHLLLDALAIVKQRYPEKSWRLDIAGDGDEEYVHQLQNQCSTLGFAQQVHWHGFLEGEAKQELLQQSDWFVLPSKSENFGIAAAEALMAGTPVVLSPGVALAAQVKAERAGFVCESTLEVLAACLGKCLEPPTQDMRQAARLLAEKQFSWESITRQLIRLYETVLLG